MSRDSSSNNSVAIVGIIAVAVLALAGGLFYFSGDRPTSTTVSYTEPAAPAQQEQPASDQVAQEQSEAAVKFEMKTEEGSISYQEQEESE